MQFGMIHPYQNFLGGLKPTENQMVELGLTDDDGMEYPFGSKAGDEKKIHRVISEYNKVIDMEKISRLAIRSKRLVWVYIKL